MKRPKLLYILPVLLSLLTGIFLISLLLPSIFFGKAIFIVLSSLTILAIGFRLITYQRIQTIRHQLYQIFQTLEEFDVDEPKKVAFEQSPFPVFNELNEYLIELIDRIRTDYQANKQFTQNASHELQTPLAIIKGHIEILLQSPNIGEKEIESLGVLMHNTNRLSKLNSALILLSKIEHHRFVDEEKVNFAQVTDDVLKNFHDLIQMNKLVVRKKYQEHLAITMSMTLAEILTANLIQNSIRHNIDNGFIEITIKSNCLLISNSGAPLNVSPKTLFKRFKRETTADDSLGLGLAIVKRICDQSGLLVNYEYANNIHTLEVSKKK